MTHELYEKLTQIQWLLNKQMMRGFAENGPMADTTRGQGRILALLKLRDGISTKELSYLLGVSISSLNELLLKLEKGGYITREPSEQDRRVMLVKLTDKGRDEKQTAAFDFDDVFSCLADEEQRTLGDYLDRIIDALHTKFSGDDSEMFKKIEALRSKFGDFGAFFGAHGHEFRGRWGFPYGRHMGFGPERGGMDRDESEEE